MRLLLTESICAEPTLMLYDLDRVLCVRRTDGGLASITRAQADVLKHLTQLIPFEGHLLNLCRDDLACKVRALTERHVLPNWLANTITSAIEKYSSKCGPEAFGRLFEGKCADLRILHEKGLIVSEHDLVSNSCGLPSESDSTKIRYVGIPTCGRPQSLARCLGSFTRNLETYERCETEIFVVDDSKDPPTRDSNCQIVSEINSEHECGPKVEYFGSQRRRRLVDLLSRSSGVPKEVLEFAFDPDSVLPTHGASRNVITAITCNSKVFITDDDTLCAYASPWCKAEDLVVSSSAEPCETRFYTTHEQNLKGNPVRCDVDALGLHEQYLGQSVSSVVGRHSAITWKDVTPDLVLSTRTGGGYIGMTATGCLGDCGLGSSVRFLTFLPTETLDHICSDDKKWNVAMYGREVFRVAPRPTIGRGKYFQPMSYGMDNTRLVPPFFPIGRNEGQLFAVLYLMLDSHLWLGHLPWTIHHLSEQGRTYLTDYQDALSRLKLPDILMLCVESAAGPGQTTSNTSLSSIGHQLMTIAGLRPSSFLSYLRAEFIRSRIALISRLEERIALNKRARRLWVDGLAKVVAKTRESLADESSIVPIDLAHAVGSVSALKAAQDYLGLYGRLLTFWEEILSQTRDLLR